MTEIEAKPVGKLPVLVLAYNRPDFTAELMTKLAEYAPPRLYVSCDGPHPAKPEDADRVEQVRQVLRHPTWQTEVTARFLDEHTGLRRAVGGAIDWFFDNEPEGIILEDDCMPSADFFRLAEHILDRYRENPQVWGMTGSNNAGVTFGPDASFGFVRHPLIWGWATWADRWGRNDPWLQTYPKSRQTIGLGGWPSRAHKLAFQRHLDYMIRYEKPDSWAYPWAWSVMTQGGLWVVPSAHLVDNVGFRDDSTHTTSAKLRGGPLKTLGAIRGPVEIASRRSEELTILRRQHGLLSPLWLNYPVNLLKRRKRYLRLRVEAKRG